MKTAILPKWRQDLLKYVEPDEVEAAFIALAVATVGHGLPRELSSPLRLSVYRRLKERLPLSGETMLNIVLTAKQEVAGGRMPADVYQKHEDRIVAACKQ